MFLNNKVRKFKTLKNGIKKRLKKSYISYFCLSVAGNYQSEKAYAVQFSKQGTYLAARVFYTQRSNSPIIED